MMWLSFMYVLAIDDTLIELYVLFYLTPNYYLFYTPFLYWYLSFLYPLFFVSILLFLFDFTPTRCYVLCNFLNYCVDKRWLFLRLVSALFNEMIVYLDFYWNKSLRLENYLYMIEKYFHLLYRCSELLYVDVFVWFVISISICRMFGIIVIVL